MQNEILDHLASNRPNTSFSVHFRKIEKNPVTEVPDFHKVRVFHHLTIKQFSEIDSFIQIRPLTATALSASEKNSPLSKKLEQICKSPQKTSNNCYSPWSSKKIRLRKAMYDVEKNKEKSNEISIDVPFISITKNKQGFNHTFDAGAIRNINKIRSDQEKKIESLRQKEIRVKFRGKIKKGSCMVKINSPMIKMVNNLKLSM